MSGKVYLERKETMRLTGLKKTQIGTILKKGQIISEKEEIGSTTRHKILAASVLLWLAAKNKWHQAMADFFEASYSELRRMINASS